MSVHALKWAWSQEVTNPTQKLVLIALADHANSDGECYPSFSTVATLANCSSRTARRHVDELCDAGLVRKGERRRRKDGTLSTWSLLLAMDSPSGHTRPVATDGQRPHMTEPAATDGQHQRPHTAALNQDLEPSVNSGADAPSKSRKADPIFDALVYECGIDPAELTKHERGKVNTAAKQLRDVGASAEGIHARANIYRQRWPDATVTATGIANNYASLGSAPNGSGQYPPGESIRDLDENGVGKGVM